MPAEAAVDNRGESAMSEDGSVESGVRRLNAAMDALEIAIGRRRASGEALGDLKSELHAITEDRSRLAQDLDQVKQRAAVLDRTNQDVAARLQSAIGTVRALLGENAH